MGPRFCDDPPAPAPFPSSLTPPPGRDEPEPKPGQERVVERRRLERGGGEGSRRVSLRRVRPGRQREEGRRLLEEGLEKVPAAQEMVRSKRLEVLRQFRVADHQLAEPRRDRGANPLYRRLERKPVKLPVVPLALHPRQPAQRLRRPRRHRVRQQRPARELAPRPRQHPHRATREERSLRRGQLHPRRQSLERYLEAPVPLALAAVVARVVVARRSPVAASDRGVVAKVRPAAVAGCVAVDDGVVEPVFIRLPPECDAARARPLRRAALVEVAEVDPPVAAGALHGPDPELPVRVDQHAVHGPRQELLVHGAVAPGAQRSERGFELGRARGERRGVQVMEQRSSLEVGTLDDGS